MNVWFWVLSVYWGLCILLQVMAIAGARDVYWGTFIFRTIFAGIVVPLLFVAAIGEYRHDLKMQKLRRKHEQR